MLTGFAPRGRSLITKEVPGLIALAAIAALWAFLATDLDLYDETLYLTQGLAAASGQRSGFTWGPVYSDLYALVSRLVRDPVNLYFVGRALASALFILGIWFAARLHVNAMWAWTVAAVAAAIPVTYVWPGVGGPAAAALVVAVSVCFKWPSPQGLGVASTLLWLTAGARPEFVLIALIVTGWALVELSISLVRGRRRSGTASTLVVTLIVIAIPSILIALHGSPLSTGERSYVAFSQHYVNHADNPGVVAGANYADVQSQTFPGATSVSEAFRVNPGAVVHHVESNVKLTPKRFAGLFVAPDFRGDPLVSATQVLPVILFLGVFAVALSRASAWRRSLRGGALGKSLRCRWRPLVLLMLLTSWAAIPVLVIFPRDHYQTSYVALVLVGAACLLGRAPRRSWHIWCIAVPITLVFSGFAAQVVIATANSSTQAPPTLTSTARMLNDAAIPRNLLQTDEGLYFLVYTPTLRAVAPEPGGARTFGDYLAKNDIRAVMLTPSLSGGPWAGLPGLGAFMQNPASFGFHEVVENSPLWIR